MGDNFAEEREKGEVMSDKKSIQRTVTFSSVKLSRAMDLTLARWDPRPL